MRHPRTLHLHPVQIPLAQKLAIFKHLWPPWWLHWVQALTDCMNSCRDSAGKDSSSAVKVIAGQACVSIAPQAVGLLVVLAHLSCRDKRCELWKGGGWTEPFEGCCKEARSRGWGRGAVVAAAATDKASSHPRLASRLKALRLRVVGCQRFE